MRFKKTTVVDAIQWEGGNDSHNKVKDFVGNDYFVMWHMLINDLSFMTYPLSESKTMLSAVKGDWIIRSKNNSYSVEKPGYFEHWQLIG